MTRRTYRSSSFALLLPLRAIFPNIPLPALPRPSAALLDVFLMLEKIWDPPCAPPLSRNTLEFEVGSP